MVTQPHAEPLASNETNTGSPNYSTEDEVIDIDPHGDLIILTRNPQRICLRVSSFVMQHASPYIEELIADKDTERSRSKDSNDEPFWIFLDQSTTVTEKFFRALHSDAEPPRLTIAEIEEAVELATTPDCIDAIGFAADRWLLSTTWDDYDHRQIAGGFMLASCTLRRAVPFQYWSGRVLGLLGPLGSRPQ